MLLNLSHFGVVLVLAITTVQFTTRETQLFGVLKAQFNTCKI